MSAVNLVRTYSGMVGFAYSLKYSVSHQSSIYIFRYDWIHIPPAIVKGDSVSRQSSIDI